MRRKVEIKLINDKLKRHTTFTKRRQGLVKKTKALCDLCDAVAAVIVFSDAGNAFFFGHPDVEEIVDRYLADHSSTLTTEGESSGASDAAQLTKAEERRGEAIRSRRFDFGDEDLGISEVDEIAAAMKELKTMLSAARNASAAAAVENIPSTDQQVQGVVNLIDLASSDRLSKSGSTGDRLKETQKDEHVPFRNSKLTYLLQITDEVILDLLALWFGFYYCSFIDRKQSTVPFFPSCSALLRWRFKDPNVCDVSPDHSSVGESLCSLRFAARVKTCEIGVPRHRTNLRSSDSHLSIG
ncbi:hypothetical protein BUALT_Bualt18G0060700 [Buddleja alternifolia]|uniref:MADS-box domain-containing protein n=1 Tax=Buddleja alternifolia TaxID=168488 RepID=A0AAV6W451_9LAMI|nr:hypothetical protein BUALT_Bualt18G0060700 [Buddleja alternifolia]